MPFESPSGGVGPQLESLLQRGREAGEQFLAWRRSRLGMRGTLLYLLASPLALATIVSLAKGQFAAALAAGSAFALLVVGGVCNRRGLVEELIAPERRYTRAAKLPYKHLAALLVGAGTFVAAAGAVGQDSLVSGAFALLAILGYHLRYRLPSFKVSFGRPSPTLDDQALQKILEQAEQRVLTIERAAYRIGNRELEERLVRIAGQGREILEQLVERPEGRFRVRKFLHVHLEGAERVASHYARTHRLGRGRELEENFRRVLGDIESVFDQQLQSMADQDAFDLDVQIEVLRKQLKEEGINGH